jgi:RHS repeat-associated protein
VYNSSGEKVGSYTYDAWGNCTVSVVSGNTTLENNIVRTINPFRYRGYYYDTETGLYYLQSRYYNPEWGRFLNADGYVNANGDLVGYNLYVYCSNNPISYVDYSGEDAIYASDKESVLLRSAGHAVVFFQGEDGKWYKTQFASDTWDKSDAIVTTEEMDFESIKKFLEGKYVDYVYLQGDFTKAAVISNLVANGQYDNRFDGKYHLVKNNCTRYVQTMLRCGPYAIRQNLGNWDYIIPQNLYNYLSDLYPEGDNKIIYRKAPKSTAANSSFTKVCLK